MPEKFRNNETTTAKRGGKSAASAKMTKKELNALVQKELFALIKGEGKTTKKSKKKNRSATSDSEESLNHLENEGEDTPEPSDDEGKSDMVAKVKAFIKKAKDNDDSSDEEWLSTKK